MTKQEALNIIEQALNIAVTKGAYTLGDTQAILSALLFLKQSEEKPIENRPPAKAAK
jgi:hypothetical protein